MEREIFFSALSLTNLNSTQLKDNKNSPSFLVQEVPHSIIISLKEPPKVQSFFFLLCYGIFCSSKMCAFVVAKHFMRNLFFPPLTCFGNQGRDEVQIKEKLK